MVAREVLTHCSLFFEIYTYEELQRNVYEELKHSQNLGGEGITYSLSDYYVSLANHHRIREARQAANQYYKLYLDALEKQYDMDESQWAITLFDAYLNEEHYPAFFIPQKAIKYLQFMNHSDRYSYHISKSICDHLPELATDRDVCSAFEDSSMEHFYMIPGELIKKLPVVSF